MSEEKADQKNNPYLMPVAIIIAGALIAAAVVVKDSPEKTTVAKEEEKKDLTEEVLPITESDHVRGARDADVFLIEYSDYRCGYCGLFHDTVTQVIEEYDGQVAWVYRHSPFQPGGKEAAIASECVAEQLGDEGFWEYTDAVFADQQNLNAAWHVEQATTLGADKTAFETCVSSGKYDQLILEQTTNAQTLGSRGTPFNVLLTKEGDTLKFSGAQSPENVKILVNKALSSLE